MAAPPTKHSSELGAPAPRAASELARGFAYGPGYACGGVLSELSGCGVAPAGIDHAADAEHSYWMHRALVSAMTAGGRANPNPTVGAVIVKNGVLLATGATERYGGRHAERCAIDAIVNRDVLRGATLYTTLEPCSHWGRQPPCAELVAACGFARCVIGLRDPNPFVAGRGVACVRSAGTEIVCGVLRNELIAWHLAYLSQFLFERPLLSALGELVTTARTPTLALGRSGAWELHDSSRRYRDWLREKSDATLCEATEIAVARLADESRPGRPIVMWDRDGAIAAASPATAGAIGNRIQALGLRVALCVPAQDTSEALTVLRAAVAAVVATPAGADGAWLLASLRAGELAAFMGRPPSWLLVEEHASGASALTQLRVLDAAHVVGDMAALPSEAGALTVAGATGLAGVQLREFYAAHLTSALAETEWVST